MRNENKLMQRVYLFAAVLLSTLMLSMAYAADPAPLHEDQAFQFQASFIRPNVILAEWHIAPGYYLYTNKVAISFSPTTDAQIAYPKGQAKYDKEHGHYMVYAGTLRVPVTLPTGSSPTTMNVDYQGCSQDGFCYPPMNKSFMLNAADLTVTPIGDMKDSGAVYPSFKSLLTDQNGVGALLNHQRLSSAIMLLVFAGLGLLLAFTPCVLPMVPILTSIIVGQKHAPGTRKALLLSLTYVLGMSVTYAGAGMVAASLGSSLQVWLQKPITIAVVSSIFLLLALSLFGLYELRFSRRWQNWVAAWSNQHEGGTYIGVFFMGVLATLVVSPCVTAPLVGVLIYIGQTGNLLFGASALFVMGLGMGIPLLLIGMSAGKWLPKSGAWMKAVKELFGIFMVAMAVWLLSRIVSTAVTYMLFGLVIVGFALFVGLYLPRLVRIRKINRTIGVVSGLLGLFLVFNGINMAMVHTTLEQQPKLFTVVRSVEDFNRELALAKAANRPVLLDFYADWCASCVVMDKTVFAAMDVRPALDQFVLLRADLSSNTATDSELMKYFKVIAPPTVLFFNVNGQEVNSRRIVGELGTQEFMTRLSSFMTASCDKKVQC